jgi:chemotaxis methyl-accepting protein methylase
VDRAAAGQVYRGDLNRFIAKIDDTCALDLAQYRPQYLERRIATRLRSLDLQSYRQYADYLDAHPEEYARLIDAFTINVTDFFRDAPVYDIFRDSIVPDMLAHKLSSRHRMIRAWSAGCATGEEPYSVAMCFLDAMTGYDSRFLLSVLGTDVDENVLRKAKAASYPIKGLSQIPEEYRERFVIVREDSFEVKPSVTKHVKFRRLNLFTDRPISVVDVIFCRNVFIYFNREQQDKVLESFWSALSRGGYLVLGRSEKLSQQAARRFELVNGRERIYRKPLDRSITW